MPYRDDFPAIHGRGEGYGHSVGATSRGFFMPIIRPHRRWVAGSGAFVVVAALGLAGGSAAPTPLGAPASSHRSGESLSQFALEQPDAALLHRHAPLAVLKEALEPGKEQAYGPAQQDYSDRA